MTESSAESRDHQGLEVLSTEECWSLVAEVPVGRVAFVEDGEPTILPVNHAVIGHRVVFRTAKGMLLHEALMDRPIAFEVDGFDEDRRSGWSVLLRGRAGLAEPSPELDQLELDPWADAIDRNDWVAIMVEEITGRRIVRD